MTKHPGCCISCGAEVYEVLTRDPEGSPIRLGRMQDHGTQLEFLMSDGSEIDITCCLECAKALTQAQYPAIWQTTVDAVARSLAHRPQNEQRTVLATYLRLWPVALLRCRREDSETGRLVVDRRRSDAG